MRALGVRVHECMYGWLDWSARMYRTFPNVL